MKKKQRTRYFLILLAISAVLAVILIPKLVILMNRQLAQTEITVGEVDITYTPDGTYYARFESAQMSATVGVTVENARIKAIVLSDSAGIEPSRLKKLTDDVIKYQMLNSPEFPDYSYSDKIILKAIEKALTERRTEAP